LSVKHLVEVTTTGIVEQTWDLPSCVGDIAVLNNQSSGQLIVQLHIGFGNGACGRYSSERVEEIDGARLRTIYVVPNS
jgi:hypothetical protein